jgi:hypothetical protein
VEELEAALVWNEAANGRRSLQSLFVVLSQAKPERYWNDEAVALGERPLVAQEFH